VTIIIVCNNVINVHCCVNVHMESMFFKDLGMVLSDSYNNLGAQGLKAYMHSKLHST